MSKMKSTPSLVLLLFTAILLGKVGNGLALEIKENVFKRKELFIPTAEITLIWEHYCMKHMARSEWHLARLNQRAIEFQRETKLYYTTSPDQLSHFQKKLEEARAAKAGASGPWGCNPPGAKLAFVELKVGAFGETKISQSFISNTDKSIDTRATILIDSSCKLPKIEWNISVPKYGLHKTGETSAMAAEGDENAVVLSNGLSGDETLWGCDANFGCGYIVYEVSKNSLNLVSKVENTIAIPKAPSGDRGGNFKVDAEAKLSCDGVLSDKVNTSVMQDDKDQLRQEYVDMEKKTIPKREELTDQGDTKHFTVKKFNASQKVDGGQYEYILCKILDKLKMVRSKAGSISMSINSGYRNPYKHHNILKAKTKESLHLYGWAADISLDDFNGDGKTNEQDRLLVNKSAKTLGACIEPAKKTKTWIHLDWRDVCPPGW